jgi:hypothetical protein
MDLTDFPALVSEGESVALAEIDILTVRPSRDHGERHRRTAVLVDVTASASYLARVDLGQSSLPDDYLLA